ncbi:hypothetical protein C8R43DRAFT_577674 [Mycena crocata]|nr:hypothetical protein C8R43DRAFT_577674 [Mycena crocata]
MNTTDAPWRIKTRPCPFYQQGRCVFEQSCNFVHDISIPTVSTTSSSSSRLPELLDALRDVLDPPDTISLVSEHGTSPHISGEGWTLVNDASLLSPVSLPDVHLSRLSTLKNNDSFDSGYAGSEWSSPLVLPSTLNLIAASPFGSPSSRMSISGSRLFARSPFTSPMSNRDDSPELDSPESLDSPSRASRSDSTVVAPGEEEVDDDDDAQYSTAQWQMSPNTTIGNPPNTSRFSSSTEDTDSDSDPEDQSEDATAQLAYLASPAVAQTFPSDENDTINTLYDVYLHSPPQHGLPSDDRERIRAPVFTPPPPTRKFNPRKSSTPPVSGRSESRNGFPSSVFSDSPELPPRSFSSMSNRGRVSFGFRNDASSSAHPEPTSPELIPSRRASTFSANGGKVPFGFRSESRNSRRGVGPVSASAAETSFSANSMHSPRKRRISRSVAPPSASALRTSFFEPPESTSATPPTVKGLKHLRLSTLITPPPSSFTFPDSASNNSNVPPRRATAIHSASPSISVPSLV